MWCVSPLFIHTLLHYSVTLNTVVEIPKLRVFTNHRWPFRSPASTYLRAHFIPCSFLFPFPSSHRLSVAHQSRQYRMSLTVGFLCSTKRRLRDLFLSSKYHPFYTFSTTISSFQDQVFTESLTYDQPPDKVISTRFYARCMSHRSIAELSECSLTIQPFCGV